MGHLFTKVIIPESEQIGYDKLPKGSPIKNEPSGINQQPTTPFEKTILDLHNKARIKNNLEPLVWDKALQQKAEDWNMFMKQQDNAVCVKMRHPGTGPDGSEEEVGKFLPNGNGQNLYQSHGAQLQNGEWVPHDTSSPQDAVRQWYDECKIWKSPNPGQQVPDRFLEVGHMTQLLWKDAKKIGCSQIDCTGTQKVGGKNIAAGGKIINCHYDKGNIAGQFQTKVPDGIFCDKTGNHWITKK